MRAREMLTRVVAMGTIAFGVPAAVPPLTGQSVVQSAAHRAPPAPVVGDRCPAIQRPTPPKESQRRAARELAARAQEAAVVSDNVTARELYRRSAQLDPTDIATAYALGRMYEDARDARAVAEYCRFLSLAPDAAEAPDIRRRIAALSYDLGTAPPSARATVAGVRRPPPKPGEALAYGIVFPGLGQYYTHRPLLGMVVTAVTAGAVYYALQTQTVATPVTRTATDPFGNTYQYQDVVSHTERPHMAAGTGTAIGISLLAAIEAYTHAKNGSQP